MVQLRSVPLELIVNLWRNYAARVGSAASLREAVILSSLYSLHRLYRDMNILQSDAPWISTASLDRWWLMLPCARSLLLSSPPLGRASTKVGYRPVQGRRKRADGVSP